MHDLSEALWNVLYTKPHREELVCSWLSKQGMQTYLPAVRPRDDHRQKCEQPFFPCYLFARLDLERHDLTSLGWTPGLRRVVSFGGTPATVDDNVVEFIQDQVSRINQRGWSPFREGDRVLVTDGPFRDMIAVFERPCSTMKRVRVLLDFLGRQTECEVDIRWLRKA